MRRFWSLSIWADDANTVYASALGILLPCSTSGKLTLKKTKTKGKKKHETRDKSQAQTEKEREVHPHQIDCQEVLVCIPSNRL